MEDNSSQVLFDMPSIMKMFDKVSIDAIVNYYDLDLEFVMSQKHPRDVAMMLADMKIKYAGYEQMKSLRLRKTDYSEDVDELCGKMITAMGPLTSMFR